MHNMAIQANWKKNYVCLKEMNGCKFQLVPSYLELTLKKRGTNMNTNFPKSV